MSEERSCYCGKLDVPTVSSISIPKEREQCFDEVKSIWAKKMEESKLFLPIEIKDIVNIWVQYIQNRIASIPGKNAEQFYVESAITAANKLKYFPEDGWKCFIKEYPIMNMLCSEESLHPGDVGAKESESRDSVESTADFLGQVEFLQQLVASSNFGLSLTKTAFDPTFEQICIKLESPHLYSEPKKYLRLNGNIRDLQHIRKSLLDGEFDNYILPLQVSNEINADFWEKIDCELINEEENSII